MSPVPSTAWRCSHCGEEVDGGFAVCWNCDTDCEGHSDPSFEPVTTPVQEVEEVNPPSPLATLLMVVFFPAAIVYLLVTLLFPPHKRQWQFNLTWLFVFTTVVAVVLGIGKLLLQIWSGV